MVSAGAVSCALPNSIGPAARTRAAAHPNEPECRHCRTNPRLAAAFKPVRTNEPTRHPNEPEPHTIAERTRQAVLTNEPELPWKPNEPEPRPARCSPPGRPAAATDSHGPMDHANKRLTANG